MCLKYLSCYKSSLLIIFSDIGNILFLYNFWNKIKIVKFNVTYANNILVLAC